MGALRLCNKGASVNRIADTDPSKSALYHHSQQDQAVGIEPSRPL